jgi:Lysozyme like domain
VTSCTGATGQKGTIYTYAQLEGLWINAGGAKALAPVAAAIAEAESSGCSAAVNPTDNGGTQTSWGLWQISNGTHAQPVTGILSPAINAQQAVAKYKANGWAPWGTYTSGAYKKFLSGSTTPDTNVPSAPAGGAAAADISSVCLLGFSSSGLAGTSWINDVVGTGGNIGQGQLCLLRKSQARALIAGALMAPVLGLTLAGAAVLAYQTITRSLGGAGRGLGAGAEVAGAALTLAGAPEAGAPIAAVGSGLKHASGGSQGRAGKYAARKRTQHRQNSAEDRELAAKGASNIRTARQPIRRQVAEGTRPAPRPGRKTGTIPGAPRETGRQRAARMANPRPQKQTVPAQRDEPPF